MSKKTLLEAIIAALIFAVEVIMVFVYLFDFGSLRYADGYLMYIFTIFTNIEVVYGVILLIINSNKKD